MGLTIQFVNKESVLRAYESRAVDLWALFQGKQFLFKGDGVDELDNILTAIAAGGTNGIYTLKVYEGITDPSEIKSKTDHDGSFNFRLNEPSQLLPAHTMTSYNGLNDRLERIEELLLSSEKDVDEPEPDKNNVIGQIMGNPAVAALIPALIEKLLSFLEVKKVEKKPESGQYLSAVNGINTDEELLTVVQELKKDDPNILNNLKKLAKLAKENKELYNMLTVQLNQLIND